MNSAADEPLARATALLEVGNTHYEASELDEALAAYDEVIAEFAGTEDVAVQEEVVVYAFANKADVLFDLDRRDDGLRILDEAIARFGDVMDPDASSAVKSMRFDKAAELRSLGQYAEAVAIYDEILARCGDDPDQELDAGEALYGRGYVLRVAGEAAQAASTYQELIGRYEGVEDPSFRSLVHRARVAAANALDAARLSEEALAEYQTILAGSPEGDDAESAADIAYTLFRIGAMHQRLGHPEQAIAVYGELASRFGSATDDAVVTQVASGLNRKAWFLLEQRREAEALEVLDDLLRRSADGAEPNLVEQIAIAAVNKSHVLAATGRPDEAIAAVDGVIARLPDSTDVKIEIALARAVGAKATTLIIQGRFDEAIACSDALAERLEASPEPELRGQAALALMNKAVALGKLGRTDDVEALVEDTLARFPEEALAAIDHDAALSPALPDRRSREMAASRALLKAMMFMQLERRDEAVALLTAIIERFGDDDSPQNRLVVETARKGCRHLGAEGG